MPLYIAQSGDWVRCYRCLTHSQTLKDRATQLLLKYKSGALVTQISPVFQICFSVVQNFGNCASGSKLLLKCRNDTGSNWLLQGPGDIFVSNFYKEA